MENNLKEFPAMKIGRLGVNKNLQNQGIGSKILQWAIGYIQHHSENSVACRFITLDAYPKHVKWYTKRGFIKNLMYNSKKKDTISMRYDLLNPLK